MKWSLFFLTHYNKRDFHWVEPLSEDYNGYLSLYVSVI